jgi:hypothetical protein
MRRLEQDEARNAHEVFAAALGAAIGVPLCRLVFGAYLGNPGLATTAVFALAAFVLVGVSAWVPGWWGFLLLWVLVMGMWLLVLNRILIEARWIPFTVAILLPDRFVAWSVLALPLACATTFSVRDLVAGRRGVIVAGVVAWLALLTASAILAQHAPDVGNTPRQNPILAWPVGGLASVAPFLVSGWFLRRLSSRAQPSPRPS